MKQAYLGLIPALSLVLMCSCGNATSQPGTANASAANAPESGEAIYKRTCIACHQPSGEGLPNTFPPLAKSDFLNDKEKAITQVIKGYSGELIVNGKKYNNTMPAQPLNDAEIASVLTYINSSFGNTGSTVIADEVKMVRAKL